VRVGALEKARGTGRLVRAGAVTLARAMGGENLRLRAMALTFLSLFAIVPAIVVAFSVLDAFAGMDAVWRRVHEYLLENLAVGARSSIAPHLDQFIRNAHATSAGLVGGGILVWSAVALFRQVEHALNEIWKVRKPRSIPQRVLIYWAGLTLAPFLLAASLAFGHAVETWLAGAPVGRVAVRLGGIAIGSTVFTLLYLVVPATRVRPRAAAMGGLVAGVAWEIAKALYTWASARFFRYHAIYGSLAALPTFLLWLYVSWTIVLFGARVSFVAQHARLLLRGHPVEATPLGRELLAARAMLEIALAYDNGEAPPDPGEVALRIESFGEPVREVIGALRAQGLVLELAGGELVPGRSLAAITLADVRRTISGAPNPPAPLAGGADALVTGILAGAEGVAAESLAARSFAELCVRVRQIPHVASQPERAGLSAP
jgi:membrane protein